MRVTATGSKVFIMEKRIYGRGRCQTRGRYPELTIEQARIWSFVDFRKIGKYSELNLV